MRAQPFTHKKALAFFILVASMAAFFLDRSMGVRIDYWVHDSAIIHQYRQEWKHTAIVVLDDAVPLRVGRTQSLPLFARAIDVMIAAGVKGVFFDGRVHKEMEGRMPYATCMQANGETRWSEPQCTVTSEKQCRVDNSASGNAPLKMNPQNMPYFSIAPYMDGDDPSLEFLLYDLEAADAIPTGGVQANDRLPTQFEPIGRWVDMNPDHAVHKMVSFAMPDKVEELYAKSSLDDICDGDRRCRRVRQSIPLYKITPESEIQTAKQLIMPLSLLASCDDETAYKNAALLKNKVVIMQTTSPTEATDIIVTPMTTALFSNHLLTPGAQFLLDEVETVLNQDYPTPPPYSVKQALFVGAAILSVLLGAYFSQTLLWLIGLILFAGITSLCFFYPVMQLWPVTAVMAAYLLGSIQIISVHLVLGFKQSNLLHQFMPKQVIDLLVPLEDAQSFKNQKCQVVVLMSDLAGYTTITGLLKEPENVMNLMNDYLGETSIVLQDKYNGILEAYVGDMVCYYWKYDNGGHDDAYKNAICGAIELASLQKKFFSSVSWRYKEELTDDVLEKINTTINAGIGITSGVVVMGNLGPKEGVKKFSILGDPLNLAARIESLTRLFNTEIIVAGDFSNTVLSENLILRRLGAINVKGRLNPETLYALGEITDPRFEPEHVAAWERWVADIEAGKNPQSPCPIIYGKDQNTILQWREKTLFANGAWHLHEK